MIYGEEQEGIDFSKGLWLSDSPDNHPGFCSSLTNLYMTPEGTMVARPSLMGAFRTQHTFYDSVTDLTTNALLDNRSVSYYPRFFAKGVPLTPNNSVTNFPVLFEPHKTDAAAPFNVSIVNSAVASASHHPVGSNYIWDPTVGYPTSNYVQYSDRIYCWWQGLGVYRIYNWDFTSIVSFTLTRIQIVGSPNVSATNYSWNAYLDVYKDRLFLSIGNRVYFTETALPGGYPEDWNTTTNFLTLPVSTIYKTFVFNNILYFYTSNGIWTLQVNGPPESWILKLLTPTICVTHEQGVALNGITFYYTMNNAIYAYNGGAEFVKISDPLQEYLNECHAIGVFAFEEGCLVCAEQFEASEADSDKSTLLSTRLFYFNQMVWTEITMPFSSPDEFAIVVGSAVQVAADISNQRPTTYFTVLQGTRNLLNVYTYFVDKEHHMGDALAPDDTYTYTTVLDDPIDNIPWDFTVSFASSPSKEKRLKYGFMEVVSEEENYIMVMDINLEGKGFVPLTEFLLYKENVLEDDNYHVQFPVDNFARRIDLRLRGSISWTAPVEIAIVPSPIEIKRMSLVFNTARTEEKYVSG